MAFFSMYTIMCGNNRIFPKYVKILLYEWRAFYMKFSESLKSNRDFKDVYKRGKSYANKYIVMYVLENIIKII